MSDFRMKILLGVIKRGAICTFLILSFIHVNVKQFFQSKNNLHFGKMSFEHEQTVKGLAGRCDQTWWSCQGFARTEWRNLWSI